MSELTSVGETAASDGTQGEDAGLETLAAPRRWVERPALRQDVASGELDAYFDEQRTATWADLFLDLLVVANVASLGSSFAEASGHLGPLFVYVIQAATLFWYWTLIQGYMNRFDNEDAFHSCLSFVFCVLFALQCAATNACHLSACRSFGFILLVMRSVYVLVLIRISVQLPRAREWCIGKIITSLIVMGILLFGAFFHREVAFWAGALVVDMMSHVYPIAKLIFPDYRFPPIHIELFEERIGLIVLIAIGETIVSSTHIETITMGSMTNAVLVVTVAFIYKLGYFGNAQGRRERGVVVALRRTKKWSATFLFLHVILFVAIVLSGHVLEQILEHDSQAMRWIFCSAVASTNTCLALLQMMHKGLGKGVRACSLQVRISARIAASAAVALLPLISIHNISSTMLLVLVVAVLGAVVLVDSFGARVTAKHRGVRTSQSSSMLDSPLMQTGVF